jgi:tRNA(fMet)-specific endonuclease VapC
MTYLLDTNVWATFLRSSHSPVVPRLRAKQRADVCLCSVVVAELYYGCLRSANPAGNRRTVDALIRPHQSLPFDDVAAEQFAAIRRHLETLGTTIGPCDLQIAAIALANGCTLVTNNTREFSRLPGLMFEDWQLPQVPAKNGMRPIGRSAVSGRELEIPRRRLLAAPRLCEPPLGV